MEILPVRMPWYLAGPLMGLCIVALYLLANRRLGVSGSYIAVRDLALGRPGGERWRVWFFVGIAAGAFAAGRLRGDAVTLSYGALGELVPLALLVPLLFAGGIVAGYGARWAEGCTSGHGLSGTASRSPASWAAAATFFVTAVAVTFAVNVVTGGAL